MTSLSPNHDERLAALEGNLLLRRSKEALHGNSALRPSKEALRDEFKPSSFDAPTGGRPPSGHTDKNSSGDSSGSAGSSHEAFDAFDMPAQVPPMMMMGHNSTCVEPDYRELIHSVSTVLQRRIRDNETAEAKLSLPLFCEDTHTEPVVEDEYAVSLPLEHVSILAGFTFFTLRKLPPPPVVPREYPVPDVQTVVTFIENIWHKARLTPQSLVICLVYVDRLEARSEGVLLHARSWRPIIFASLLLASKVWHDISYWNSDFSSICPMFNLRNVNRMERAYLQLLQYNTIISSSQYAQYYFSLRHAAKQAASGRGVDREHSNNSRGSRDSPMKAMGPAAAAPTSAPGAPPGASRDNFRSKYFMAINVPSAARLQDKSAAVAQQGATNSKPIPPGPSQMTLDMAGYATSL